jgi:hypothetical protein
LPAGFGVDAAIGFGITADLGLALAEAGGGQAGLAADADAEVGRGGSGGGTTDYLALALQGNRGSTGASRLTGLLGDIVQDQVKSQFARLDALGGKGSCHLPKIRFVGHSFS